jgi:uncharacterized protein
MYEPRFYRDDSSNNRLKGFNVSYKDTDLLILAPIILNEPVFKVVRSLRKKLDHYLTYNPFFLRSLKPIKLYSDAPREALEMAYYSAMMGVGPMASVAGLFAEKAAQEVLKLTDEVIIENGGDIFLSVKEDCRVGIYAGKDSPFKNKLALRINSGKTPLGIATSSARMGPSLNFGKADCITVISPSAILADAAATAISNRVKKEDDIKEALDWAKDFEGIRGVVIIIGDKIGFQGDIEIIKRQIIL